MGSFSWLFADKENKKPLEIGMTGYLICPNNKAVKTPDGGYDGYGCFGEHEKEEIDVYEAVANWNREILSKQPDRKIPQHGRVFNEQTQSYEDEAPRALSSYAWWKYYSDLELMPSEISARMRADGYKFFDYRYIGIALSCYDDQNAALPYPIKIASTGFGMLYEQLPPSKLDPDQGFGRSEYDGAEYEEEDDEDVSFVRYSDSTSFWTSNENGKPVCAKCGVEQMCDHDGHYKASEYCPHCGRKMT